MNHLKKWWLAYGASALAVAHTYWPQVRAMVCSHEKISASVFLAFVVGALLKQSPSSK